MAYTKRLRPKGVHFSGSRRRYTVEADTCGSGQLSLRPSSQNHVFSTRMRPAPVTDTSWCPLAGTSTDIMALDHKRVEISLIAGVYKRVGKFVLSVLKRTQEG